MNVRTQGSWWVEAIRLGLPLLILAAGVGGFAAIGGRPPSVPRVEEQRRATLVETVTVREHSGGLDIEVDGLVVPFREIQLAAEVAGRIHYKAPECRAGRYVSRGTLLVEIDPRKYELEVERLNKELGQARGDLEELDVETRNTRSLIEVAEEQMALQQNHLQRTRELVKRRAVSDVELDEAKRSELTARNNLLTLNNQLRTLQTRRSRLEQAGELVAARLKQAELELAHTRIVAPVDGLIVSDSVEQDGYVQPGEPLLAIEDTSAAEVRCSLRMEDLHWLWQQAPSDRSEQQPASPRQTDYQLPAVPVTVLYRLGEHQYAWQGQLSRYEGTGLDERTRTVPCRVLVEEPRWAQNHGGAGRPSGLGPRTLMRGMYVTVVVHAQPQQRLLQLPERAVQPANVAWVVRDGRLQVLTVSLARRLNGTVLVHHGDSGLQAGDRIVVSPIADPRDGMLVREEPQP